MKVCLVMGTRPEIIRLSRVIPKLDRACKLIMVNTRQNFDINMNDIFFKELGIRDPDYTFDNHSQKFFWLGNAMTNLASVFEKERPDKVLFLGDTYSCLAAAYTAARMNIPIYHMEAGNRSHDPRMPEELNRKVIDHISFVHLPYTQHSKYNLINEGIRQSQIFVTGNPIVEVINKHVSMSNILEIQELTKRQYFILTAHRAENVEDPVRLYGIISGCQLIHQEFGYPILMSCHPNTKTKLTNDDMKRAGIRYHDPFGYNDFFELEKNALCILTDSGTCQEEACLMGTPCVTIRDNTERPETVECGSNILSGVKPDDIKDCASRALDNHQWNIPDEYKINNTSDIVTNIVTGV